MTDPALACLEVSSIARGVMRMLGLEDVADVVVGSAMVKGISGGQARRLSIGVEIVQLPDGK